MKASELRELSESELQLKLKDLKEELFQLCLLYTSRCV